METASLYHDWSGAWAGVSRLWLDPSQPAQESPSRAVVTTVAGDHFLLVRYSWEHDGAPQDGVLMANLDGSAAGPGMAWTDSWHMGRLMLALAGEPAAPGELSARGEYAAPPGPDWGWRITLARGGEGTLRLAMFNISPEGTVYPAVEAIYHRVAPGDGGTP